MERIEREYAELRSQDPDAFLRCVHAAEAVGINHASLCKLTDAEKIALLADIEQHMVSESLRARRGK